jgi:hypothetical protein
MASIVKGWESHKISHRTAQDIFRAVLQEFIPSIGLADPTDESAKTRISSTYIPSTILDSEGITQLLRQLTSLDLGPQSHQLLDKLEKLAKEEEPAIVFRGFFLPFAKELSRTSAADKSPDALVQEVQSRAQLFMENLVDLYAIRCVGPKPTPPIDWRRTKCGCGCMECLELDAFLVDPAQKEIQISTKSQDRVDHLKRQLPRIDQGRWERDKPEHDIEVTRTASGFELSIHKTLLAWSTAVKRWEEDRNAAVEEFGRVVNDENIKNSLETRLDRLGHIKDSAA